MVYVGLSQNKLQGPCCSETETKRMWTKSMQLNQNNDLKDAKTLWRDEMNSSPVIIIGLFPITSDPFTITHFPTDNKNILIGEASGN